jgi:hypothetical protein
MGSWWEKVPEVVTAMRETDVMAFGQQAGRPANARRVDQLLDEVRKAGYSDFREARHPLGLNQRQASGRFTEDEAEELITRLGTAEVGGELPFSSETKISAAAEKLLRAMPAEQLATELERRGWIVIAP